MDSSKLYAWTRLRPLAVSALFFGIAVALLIASVAVESIFLKFAWRLSLFFGYFLAWLQAYKDKSGIRMRGGNMVTIKSNPWVYRFYFYLFLLLGIIGSLMIFSTIWRPL